MWIFMNDSMLSIVADRNCANNLLVRARGKLDITRIFSNVKVRKTPNADYPFRVSVPRARVQAAIADRLELIGYTNFKNSVPMTPAGNRRHDAYLKVWGVMKKETKL